MLTYTDRAGRSRRWEAASRQGAAGAVFMVSILHPSERLIFIRQYRPPLDAYVIEFPAGLIDAGEDAGSAGLRELREETGYRGVVRWISPMACSSPGMTSETVALAIVDIDGSLPENQAPAACPDEGEDIEVLPVYPSDIVPFIQERVARGDRIDSRVTAYLMGRGMVW